MSSRYTCKIPPKMQYILIDSKNFFWTYNSISFASLILIKIFFSLQWGIAPLADNVVSDKFFYQLTVCTGMRRGAGTKSKISFVLAGDSFDTGVRELMDEKEIKVSIIIWTYYSYLWLIFYKKQHFQFFISVWFPFLLIKSNIYNNL